MKHTIQSNSFENTTFLDILKFLRTHSFMEDEEYHNIQIQIFLLVKKLVLTHTHNRTTTISKRKYHQIMNSVYYTLDHATTYHKNPIEFIKAKHIAFFYDEGKQSITALHEQVYDLYIKLKQSILPINNERYQDVILQQLLYFYHEYNIEYRATYCRQDFDYPLLDGIPLDHDMYYKKGVDLAVEYAKRLSIEQAFCQRFTTEELVTLFHNYEEHVGVSIHLLGINIMEIVLLQFMFSTLLPNQKPSLMILDSEKRYLCSLIQNTHTTVETIYQNMDIILDKQTMQYIYRYKEQLSQKIQIALEHNQLDHLIITKSIQKAKFTFHDKPSVSSKTFSQIINKIEEKNNADEKIQILFQYSLSIHDIIDILETDIFTDDHYPLLFQKLDILSIALLFKYTYPEEFVFHATIVLHTSYLHNLDISRQWQSYFLIYIEQLTDEKKNELQNILNIMN